MIPKIDPVYSAFLSILKAPNQTIANLLSKDTIFKYKFNVLIMT